MQQAKTVEGLEGKEIKPKEKITFQEKKAGLAISIHYVVVNGNQNRVLQKRQTWVEFAWLWGR